MMTIRTPQDRLLQLQCPLGEHDDQLCLALEAVGLGTWQWTPSSGEMICSPRARALLGLAAETPLNFDAFVSCVHAADRDAVIGAMGDALRGGGDLSCEYRAVDRSGGQRRLRSLGRFIHAGARGTTLLITGVLQEFGSAAQRQDRLRMFTRHLERMHELERVELADSLQQDVQEQLAHFNSTLLALSHDAALACTTREALQQLAQQAQQLHDRVGDMVFDLAPLGIGEPDFAFALRRYIDEQRECPGLQISLQLPEAYEGVSRKVLVALYSVVREAVGNAVEHAQASRIDVSVELRGDHVRARISDDGIGIGDAERSQPGRFGLFAAGETLSQLDGALRVFGVAGSGTVVEASVPLNGSNSVPHPGARSR